MRLKNKKKPIGIFGGTFDPIHFGHLRCAVELYQDLNLQEVRLIPCKKPVHKAGPSASAEQRKKMVELAIVGEKGLLFDSRELDRKSPSYMAETLQSIRDEVGEQSLCLIVGVDAFMEFDTWHRWEGIIDLAHIIVIHRPDYQMQWRTPIAELLKPRLVDNPAKLTEQPAGFVLMHSAALLTISATQIRTLIRDGKSPRYLLPKTVLDAIYREKVYQN